MHLLGNRSVKRPLGLSYRVLDKCKPPCNCEVCRLAKMRRPGPFSKNDQVLRLAELDCMEYVVSDVTGPIYPTSKSGKRYIIHFTCVKTGYVCIYFREIRSLYQFSVKRANYTIDATSAPRHTLPANEIDGTKPLISDTGEKNLRKTVFSNQKCHFRR